MNKIRLSPVKCKRFYLLSTMEQVKLCRKSKGPPLKTKYSLMTDREKYCEGMIEKYFEKNDEIIKLNTKNSWSKKKFFCNNVPFA